MFTNDNQTLRSISRLIRNHFISYSRVDGILSPQQSVGSIKESIWSAFAQTIGFLDFNHFIILLLCFIFCTINCMCVCI